MTFTNIEYSEYEQLSEKILKHFVEGQFRDELLMAKKEFFENSGTLDEHSDHFEARMSQFYDWYFLTRELKGYGKTPLESSYLERELRFSERENELLESFKKFRHSLFEFIKIKGTDIYIKDLLRNEKIVVKQCPWIYGFDPDEVFEARLIPSGDSWIFTKGFCFHPESAKKFILSEVKRHRKDPDLDPDVMMLRLIKMRYKFEQYKHVKPEMIYTNESKLGL
ncbi:MAG: hypothetical protein ACLGGX_02140 [Bdellovibrionia bacterium]